MDITARMKALASRNAFTIGIATPDTIAIAMDGVALMRAICQMERTAEQTASAPVYIAVAFTTDVRFPFQMDLPVANLVNARAFAVLTEGVSILPYPWEVHVALPPIVPVEYVTQIPVPASRPLGPD